jgi:hypothetical protein
MKKFHNYNTADSSVTASNSFLEISVLTFWIKLLACSSYQGLNVPHNFLSKVP